MVDEGTSASRRTEDAVKEVDTGIKTLDDSLETLITMGSGLVNESSWQGPHAESFRGAWEGKIKRSLNESMTNLRHISGEARQSEQNIRAAGGDGSAYA